MTTNVDYTTNEHSSHDWKIEGNKYLNKDI